MDGAGDSGVNGGTSQELVNALNEQVIPQLNLLGRGPLALATLKALQAAVEHAQGVSATVLQLRVELDGRLYDVAVSVTVSP
jgi:hypothetical protein